ncbi:MAG: hypothetical protein ACLQDY_12580 [Streptosporangiaceae bacterium]
MTRRRSREQVGDPLFGEKRRNEDQQLFQDSLARRSAARPRPRRTSRRPAQHGTLPGEYEQDTL